MAENSGQSQQAQQRRRLEDRKMALLTVIDILKSKKHFFFLTLTLTLLGTFLGHSLKVATYETTATLL